MELPREARLPRRIPEASVLPHGPEAASIHGGLDAGFGDAEESNRRFADIYAQRRFVNQPASQLANRKQDAAVQLLQNPQWRYWMNKALYYNSRNGLPEEKVPPGLQKLLPLKK